MVPVRRKIVFKTHLSFGELELSGKAAVMIVVQDTTKKPSTKFLLAACLLSSKDGERLSVQALQKECCLILSKLLEAFKSNPTNGITNVLGEQLQFLVSKLVACCIPSESTEDHSSLPSSQVMSLLCELTVDSDPSLYDYIRELEPFPEIDCFNGIHTFHQELCKYYSPRDHFLKFVRRTTYLPQRLLLWSLETLHTKLLQGEIIHSEKDMEYTVKHFNNWRCEPEIVSAVWMLVSMCGSNDGSKIRGVVSDFISRIGIGDPHCVVFHLPEEASQTPRSSAAPWARW
ncbi:serine/threonine-protein kinase ATM [Thalictrum thalictroides]|uniref:Serine/threonine-protein kinase ATM n=1 Tax=Thalictrum thalictroides TaxID=46969 RepID=A0A7J6WNG7_THATH|nr:serine/threonine-protein kinase ATM [Thalictrum thalictroides]